MTAAIPILSDASNKSSFSYKLVYYPSTPLPPYILDFNYSNALSLASSNKSNNLTVSPDLVLNFFPSSPYTTPNPI